MKRSMRNAVAAAVTAAVAFGVTAPAATAAPQAKSKKVHVKRVSAKAHGKNTDRLLTNARRVVVREISRKDAALVRVARQRGMTDLEPTVLEVVQASVQADRDNLVVLATAAASATSLVEVRDVQVQVRAVRPEIYNTVVSNLRRAAHLESQVAANVDVLADLDEQIAVREAAGEDMTDVRLDLDEATYLNDEAAFAVVTATDAALLLNATSTRADLYDVKVQLGAVAELLEQVEGYIEAIEAALADSTVAPTDPSQPTDPTV
jgi:hypothetical protein